MAALSAAFTACTTTTVQAPAPVSGLPDAGAADAAEESDDAVAAETAALFEIPSDPAATPNAIGGLWMQKHTDATAADIEARMKIGKDSITIAHRCSEDSGSSSDLYASITFAASVTRTSIDVLESKEAGSLDCRLLIAEDDDLKACASTVDLSLGKECFWLEGRTIEFTRAPFAWLGKWTKLTD